MHSSLNLAFRQRKFHNLFIFGTAYSELVLLHKFIELVIQLPQIKSCLFSNSKKNTLFWCTITKYTGCTRELVQPKAHGQQDLIRREIVIERKQLQSGLMTLQTPGHPSELMNGQPINNDVILQRCPFT